MYYDFADQYFPHYATGFTLQLFDFMLTYSLLIKPEAEKKHQYKIQGKKVQ